MKSKKCIAMVLAGGRGERLGALTHYYSKPAIYFGGGNRIIDFTLSSCKNSKIETIAVLSQYFTADLNEYITSVYGGESGNRGVHLLPSKNENCSYKGTADAVYRNFAFIERCMPEHVLILASDHVYKMDYNNLLAFHEEKGAEVTIASVPVSMEEAPRFGIINADETGRVLAFEEKPQWPKSNLASMGIYIFKWDSLKKYLRTENCHEHSKHDFGKDILPEVLSGRGLYTYQFNGYWRDVGTVDKLWEANMEQLDDSHLQLKDNEWGVCNTSERKTDAYLLSKAGITRNSMPEGFSNHGCIRHSVLGNQVTIGRGVEIVNSVIMPNVYIGDNVKIINAIVGNHAIIRDGVMIGDAYGDDFFVDRQMCAGDVSLVSPWVDVNKGMIIQKNSHVIKEKLMNYHSARRRSEYNYEAANFESDMKCRVRAK